mmetsp:Transcript_30258/g.50282  ORF Transcript_30258/g.50282 Transcript_30258/m.50282 type:complete len:89 (+) Transcript_30258:701-967(+)
MLDVLYEDGYIDQFLHYESILEVKCNYTLPTTVDQFRKYIGPMFNDASVPYHTFEVCSNLDILTAVGFWKFASICVESHHVGKSSSPH